MPETKIFRLVGDFEFEAINLTHAFLCLAWHFLLLAFHGHRNTIVGGSVILRPAKDWDEDTPQW